MPISTLWVIILLNRQNFTGAEHLQMAKQQISKKQVWAFNCSTPREDPSAAGFIKPVKVANLPGPAVASEFREPPQNVMAPWSFQPLLHSYSQTGPPAKSMLPSLSWDLQLCFQWDTAEPNGAALTGPGRGLCSETAHWEAGRQVTPQTLTSDRALTALC